MEYDRNGIFLNWKRPQMDLPEMDRFHMLEMEYSLEKNKHKRKRRKWRGMTGGVLAPERLTGGSALGPTRWWRKQGKQGRCSPGCRDGGELDGASPATKRRGGGAQRGRHRIPHPRV